MAWLPPTTQSDVRDRVNTSCMRHSSTKKEIDKRERKRRRKRERKRQGRLNEWLGWIRLQLWVIFRMICMCRYIKKFGVSFSFEETSILILNNSFFSLNIETLRKAIVSVLVDVTVTVINKQALNMFTLFTWAHLYTIDCLRWHHWNRYLMQHKTQGNDLQLARINSFEMFWTSN